MGEELDRARLYAFLQANLPEMDAALDSSDLLIEKFPFGFSNLTYRVQLGPLKLVLRRPPVGANVKSGHDMKREHLVLSSLAPIYPKVPRPVLYCDDLAVLGAPFYLMEEVEGVILRDTPPAALDVSAPVMERVSRAFIENLATIHALDYGSTALQSLARLDSSYVARQIKGWSDRYARAKTDDLPDIERVGGWLAEHLVPDVGLALIHNDYKYDNVILNPQDLTELVAVLDWEMATIGDPLMDLGTTLAYWVEVNDSPELRTPQPRATVWPGNFDRRQLVQHYALKSGREVDHLVFYYVYGLFKLAVISQQIYARFRQGFTADPRFGRLLDSIKAFGQTALRAIEKNRIDQLA